MTPRLRVANPPLLENIHGLSMASGPTKFSNASPTIDVTFIGHRRGEIPIVERHARPDGHATFAELPPTRRDRLPGAWAHGPPAVRRPRPRLGPPRPRHDPIHHLVICTGSLVATVPPGSSRVSPPPRIGRATASVGRPWCGNQRRSGWSSTSNVASITRPACRAASTWALRLVEPRPLGPHRGRSIATDDRVRPSATVRRGCRETRASQTTMTRVAEYGQRGGSR